MRARTFTTGTNDAFVLPGLLLSTYDLDSFEEVTETVQFRKAFKKTLFNGGTGDTAEDWIKLTVSANSGQTFRGSDHGRRQHVQGLPDPHRR